MGNFVEYSFGWSCWYFWRKVARSKCRMGLKEVVGIELEDAQSVGAEY